MNGLEHFFNNGTVKSLALSALLGLGGWTAHTLISTEGNSQTLAAHGRQLDTLEQGQDKTQEALQGLSVAVAKIDGKLDVVNQKIDDDRRANRAARSHP